MTTISQPVDEHEHIGRRHHNANQVFRLLLGQTIARMIEDDPSILDRARKDQERKRSDAHLRHGVQTWDHLLERDPRDIAARLRADDAEGDYVRETMPIFGVIDERLREDLVRRSRKAFKTELLSR